MNMIAYFLFSLKRVLKKPLNLVLLFLFPMITITGLLLPASKEEVLQIAVYTDAPNGFSRELADLLTTRKSAFHFVEFPDEVSVLESVTSGNSECGYLIPADLEASLNAGKKKNLITVVTSSSTTMNKITDEIVYSELFSKYSLHILTSYLVFDSVLDAPQESEIASLYLKYSTNGSTFAFDYAGQYTDYHSITGTVYNQTVRGLLSILVLLGGFSGLLTYCNDTEQHIYSKTPKQKHLLLLLVQVSAPVLLFLAITLFSMALQHTITSPRELLRVVLYGGLVILLCMLLYIVLRRKSILLTILPFYILGCMIFTPVFIDITAFLPKLRTVSRIFITYYML